MPDNETEVPQHLRGNGAPVEEERTLLQLEVEGRIPPELDGPASDGTSASSDSCEFCCIAAAFRFPLDGLGAALERALEFSITFVGATLFACVCCFESCAGFDPVLSSARPTPRPRATRTRC